MPSAVLDGIDVFEKDAAESDLFDFDFRKRRQFRGVPAQTITGTPTVAADGSGLVLGTPVVSGSVVQIRVSGGTSGTTYKITCTIVTSGGDTLRGFGRLRVP